MSTIPAQPQPGAGRTWVSIVAGFALACALAPLLSMLSIISWSSATVLPPYAAIVLALVALAASSHRRAGRARLMALLALGTVFAWALMIVAFGVELLYG
jgi:hypothetical protein